MDEKVLDKLLDNYLNDDQINFLIDSFVNELKSCFKNVDDKGICLSEEFLTEMSCWWAAYEINCSEFYQGFVRQMLISPDYIYEIRDYFIIAIYKE